MTLKSPPSNEVALAPCPFCGGTDGEDNACQMAKVATTSFKSAIGKTAYRVECGCGAVGPSDLVWGKARNAWNTRASTPAVGMREALEHAHARFECLAEDFKEAGDQTSWAMCSVDADRMLRALSRTPSHE